jgi:hypothetical protein
MIALLLATTLYLQTPCHRDSLKGASESIVKSRGFNRSSEITQRLDKPALMKPQHYLKGFRQALCQKL